jgi:hypothetical protein
LAQMPREMARSRHLVHAFRRADGLTGQPE